MADVTKAPHASKPNPVPIAGHDEQAQILVEFLSWIQNTHGLSLCHPFKPQYDWYMPSMANNAKLAAEFVRERFDAEWRTLQRSRLI